MSQQHNPYNQENPDQGAHLPPMYHMVMFESATFPGQCQKVEDYLNSEATKGYLLDRVIKCPTLGGTKANITLLVITQWQGGAANGAA